MSSHVISAEKLSKRYFIGHNTTDRHQTLRESLYGGSAKLLQRTKDALLGRPIMATQTQEELWALRDVSFQIGEGEVVGVIGRNGGGKSTLLKILSRITEPTSGKVTIQGRIASLLEVGTGFHAELTGRENIYLNGAVLGMSRADITRRFDEIVAFAEIDRFLDTPVKRYSSGMYVRLAFAVAAHLEPDILIVDEVLAVGDAQFQKKCLGKMGEVASRQGRTVLFVSHQMSMISSLCERAILLHDGGVVFDGRAGEAIAQYYSGSANLPYDLDFTKQSKKVGDAFATLLSARIEDEQGHATGEVDIRRSFRVTMSYALHQSTAEPPFPNIHFYNSQGQLAFVGSMAHEQGALPGEYQTVCEIPANLLNADTYFIDLALTFPPKLHIAFHERSALSVLMTEAIDETLYESPRSGYSGVIPGTVRPRLNWKIDRVP